MQVRIGNNALLVLVGSIDVTTELMDTSDTIYYSNNTISIDSTSNKTVEMTFTSGVSVEVTLQVGLLAISVKLPEDFMMVARGLLGNFEITAQMNLCIAMEQ